MDRYDFMKEAIRLALSAKNEGEIPVGCVIVKDNIIIAEGRNQTETKNSPTRHAEMIAIENAAQTLGRNNLSDCDLYVTLEPCPMCAGAIINAKIRKVVFGAYDVNYGACDSALQLFSIKNIHKPECYGGIMEEKCSEIITDFFKKIRKDK